MLAINGKLGFEPIGEHVILGRDLVSDTSAHHGTAP
jgi:hypothetical protein